MPLLPPASLGQVPWITVDDAPLVADPGDPAKDPVNENQTRAFRQQFLLGKRICRRYEDKTGKTPPMGCAKFPQSDEQVGKNPWSRFPHNNFTAFIMADQQAKVAELRQVEAAKELQESVHTGWQVFLGAVLLALAASCCCTKEALCAPWRNASAAYHSIGDGTGKHSCKPGQSRRADSSLLPNV